jgi:hypothetical protein
MLRPALGDIVEETGVVQELQIQGVAMAVQLLAEESRHPGNRQAMRQPLFRHEGSGQGQSFGGIANRQPLEPFSEVGKILRGVGILENAPIPDRHVLMLLEFQKGFQSALAVMGEDGRDELRRNERGMAAPAVERGIDHGIPGKGGENMPRS